MTEYASSLGYHTLVDGAALAATSILNLSDYPIDAMAVSFYKMFGYPTGVGALIIKTAFLAQLKRPWFSGGTVDVVQVPGNIVTRACQPHEQFEVCLPLSDMQHLIYWACLKPGRDDQLPAAARHYSWIALPIGLPAVSTHAAFVSAFILDVFSVKTSA